MYVWLYIHTQVYNGCTYLGDDDLYDAAVFFKVVVHVPGEGGRRGVGGGRRGIRGGIRGRG